MPARHLKTGREGEDAAAAYLRRKGYRVIDRNWRRGGLELDLVCEHSGMLVFVEVKTRGRGSLVPAVEAVDRVKRSRLARAAGLYLSEKNRWDAPCRFDLVGVTEDETGFSVEHVPDAFDFAPSLGGGHTAWQPW